jgi:pimeloyl-ACP methyl ester carboxylesterase
VPSVDAAGSELYYERSGSGEPLLLAQGFTATHLSWGRPFLSQLEESFECIVFDNRGMGNSGRAKTPFTIADLAADVLGLLDALEIERAHLLGFSMGSMVGQEIAISHPERLRTLTLFAAYCGGPDSTRMAPEDLEILGAAFASGDRDRIRRMLWEVNLSAGFREDDSRFADFDAMASALPASRQVIFEQIQAMAGHDTSARLGQVSTPTLIVHGAEDKLIPVANGRQVAALIPDARLELLEGVGHLLSWEQPERSAELLSEHASAG